jgi:hypothetical protein
MVTVTLAPGSGCVSESLTVTVMYTNEFFEYVNLSVLTVTLIVFSVSWMLSTVTVTASVEVVIPSVAVTVIVLDPSYAVAVFQDAS